MFVLIIPYGFLDYIEQTDGQMCAKTSLWIFFVLLNAFYCGALTMFFSSEFRIPFISIEDVMNAYPSWKLKMLNGNDVHFQYKAIQVVLQIFKYLKRGQGLAILYGRIGRIENCADIFEKNF